MKPAWDCKSTFDVPVEILPEDLEALWQNQFANYVHTILLNRIKACRVDYINMRWMQIDVFDSREEHVTREVTTWTTLCAVCHPKQAQWSLHSMLGNRDSSFINCGFIPECKTMQNVSYCGKVISNTAIFMHSSESHQKSPLYLIVHATYSIY